MKILWSQVALSRFSEMIDYIAIDSPVQAEKWSMNILKTIKQLEAFPKSGRVVPEVGIDTIRELISGNYRIIYEMSENHISILTLRHCKRLLNKDELQISDDN